MRRNLAIAALSVFAFTALSAGQAKLSWKCAPPTRAGVESTKIVCSVSADQPVANGFSASLNCDHPLTGTFFSDGAQYANADSGHDPKDTKRAYFWFHQRNPTLDATHSLSVTLRADEPFSCGTPTFVLF